MEGTIIRADAGETSAPLSEGDVEERFVELRAATAGMGLVLLASEHRPARHDLPGRAASQPSLCDGPLHRQHGGGHWERQHPQAGAEWERVHVYVPRCSGVKVKQAEAFERVQEIKPYRLYEEGLAATPAKFVTKVDGSVIGDRGKAGALAGAQAAWSMYSGYLGEPSGKRLQENLTAVGVPLVVEHTSGHAFIDDLQRLARALDPDAIVPIHSFGGHRYADDLDRVTERTAGQWWTVRTWRRPEWNSTAL